MIIASIACFLLWWFYFRIEDYTDDAYVHGNPSELTAQVSGIVKSIYADNTQFVLKNQVLVELDTTDHELSLQQRMADLGQQVRHVATLFDDVVEKQANVMRADAELIKANQDYNHRAGVIDIGGVSLEDFEHSEAQLRAAQAELMRAKATLASSEAKVENTTIATHPLVIASQEKVKEAYVNLVRCKILSPVDGILDKRSIQVGQWVNPTDPLLAVIPLSQMWVEANYKETQLKRVRIGQSVKMHADLYGHDVTFNGQVVGLGAGTGSAFALLPPQNATGNWIKIVQRLPVRVNFEPEQLHRYPLRIGLSMTVTVDTKDEKGLVIPQPTPLQTPLYSTDIYSEQEEGVESLIQKIMLENMPNE